MATIDLNLLAVFDALYDLHSVTRAAQRLNLTQSAVSHALRRLRDAVGDPLFVRSGGSLQPTPRAQEMAPGVREGLARLRTAMMPLDFDPSTAVRTFTLAAGAYFCALLIPRLIARMRTVAPGITFRIVPVGPDLLSELDEGTVELGLGAFDQVPQRLSVQPLFREDMVWIAATGNPVHAQRLTPEELLRSPRLVVATRRPFEPVTALLADGALERRSLVSTQFDGAGTGPVPAIVYDALTAAAIVSRTDMIALVPRRLAHSEGGRLGLRILEIAGDSRGIELAMVTHDRTAPDAGLAWLRAQIVALGQQDFTAALFAGEGPAAVSKANS